MEGDFMNQFLEEKTGVYNLKESLKKYREMIEIAQKEVEHQESLIRKYSIFSKGIINFINVIVNENYNLNYRVVKVIIPEKRNIKKSKYKYKYLLVSELLKEVPELYGMEYFKEIENENIVVIGNTQRISSVKEVEFVSFYNRSANRNNTLDFENHSETNVDSIYYKIMNFINQLIMYRYENDIKILSMNEMSVLYNQFKDVYNKKFIK